MKKNKLDVNDSVVLEGIINKSNYDPEFLKQLFADLSKTIGDENAVQEVLIKNSVSGSEMLKQTIDMLAKTLDK